ncbi:hypothetical protein IEO21_03030 [Rhodonia placenta]|uniref:WW domain-containing protein n=1 Tax=Rhodonia placenta TaxID=104341 RepID=A0A8H7P6J8_9APHY|nr:hypothetical protein IEO21_03030 [Postia placenta]
MVQRERRMNGHSKSGHELPPDWEIRRPRNGGQEQYYYNTKTHESTWTRPGLVREGRSLERRGSDAKARTDARTDEHTDELEGRAQSRKEPKRRPSPSSGLSYEDRHYRPGASSSAGGSSTQQQPHSDPLPVPRPPSPRSVPERRQSRSVSPTRREHQAQAANTRSRRDVSSPRLVTDSTWRDPQRDDVREMLQSRQVSTPERRWGPSRAAESMTGRSPEDRLRGRSQRIDVDPLHQLPPKDPVVRHEGLQWSAPSTLSPSSPSLSCLADVLLPRWRTCRRRCLEKPWELRLVVYRIIYPAFSRDRHKDAHHGFLFSPFSIPPLSLSAFSFSSCRA